MLIAESQQELLENLIVYTEKHVEMDVERSNLYSLDRNAISLR